MIGEEDGGWHLRRVRVEYEVGVWKAIIYEWEVIKGRSCFFTWEWRRIKFGKDLWCEDQILKEIFPNLFYVASNKEGCVAKDCKVVGEGAVEAPIFQGSLTIGSWRK